MAPPEAEVAAAAGDVEEAAAPLVPGSGARRASAAATPRDVHLLSSAFLFVFLAYHAAQNLQSTVNTDENLGSISLGVLYTSFTAFSAVGSAVVRWMGSRCALVVGTSGYLLFIAANLAPSWWTRNTNKEKLRVEEERELGNVVGGRKYDIGGWKRINNEILSLIVLKFSFF
ncbi:hypothetical protein PAHAL_3G465000 [Panicum hallii]|uniref:Uncharacterized protein n=1 Tax=Panicum hallii TaxID=206008 RepID=A0A2T8KLK2_9POAL|nr:hypothetical protein PAHAL_3G465000 [Panicum hallii]